MGLVFVIALYFWAPLLAGWIKKDDRSEKPVPAIPATSGVVAMPSTSKEGDEAKSAQKKAAVHTWEEWDQWIQEDPRTKAAKELLARRDPFHPIRSAVAEKQVKKAAEPVRVTITPASLGMQLSSTVVGPSPRLVVINGKVYKEGETFTVSKAGRRAAFTLAEVHPRQVVLLSQNERFELKLVERKRSGRLELSSSQQ